MDEICIAKVTDLYAAVGLYTEIFWENLLLSKASWPLRFFVECDLGYERQGGWCFNPTQDDVGTHHFNVTITDTAQIKKATLNFNVHVPDVCSGIDKEINLLFIGDSLTHATVYVNEIADLLSRNNEPQWNMFGTHEFNITEEFNKRSDHESGFIAQNHHSGVKHEGWSGKTWDWHLTQGPMCFDQKLDLQRYFAEKCNGQVADMAVFMLGINDCFSAAPHDCDDLIKKVLDNAQRLIDAFQTQYPKIALGVCNLPAVNMYENAFWKSYRGEYSRDGWKQIQFKVNAEMRKRFGKSYSKKQWIIPTDIIIDPIDGYPFDNAVHPNAYGYGQLGKEIYSWIKYIL